MSTPPDPNPLKSDLFRALGYGGDPARYEAALEEDGLSNPRKPRISPAKREAVATALTSRFVRVCARGDCVRRAPEVDARTPAPAASQEFCEICNGSVTKTGVRAMIEACASAGWSRIVVVGGSSRACEELREAVGDALEVRFVDGTLARDLKTARADLKWAHRVVIWASTPLAHRVSNLYKGDHVITVAQRGVAAVAEGIVRSARGGRGA